MELISKKINLFLLFMFLQNILLFSQNLEKLNTIQLFNPQTNDMTPVISLNERLILSFDEINEDVKRYSYKIIRMDKDWNPSQIFKSEWIKGYDSDNINSYRNSFNTLVNYTHYKLEIPNRNTQIVMSGNYIVEVFGADKSKAVFSKKFCVYESLTDIGVFVNRINGSQIQNQKVDVRIASNNVNLVQGEQNGKLVVIKNNNFNEVLSYDSPVFATPSQLNYNQLDLRFKGGTEYLSFDTKNKRISGLNTERIISDSIYQTVLYVDEFYEDDVYIDRPDINGNYYIRNLEAPNPIQYGYESDYTNVHFALKFNKLIPDDNKICIYGAFNDYSCTNVSDFLQYNPSTGYYETSKLLKQGYYNYNYAVYNESDNTYDFTIIPGNYWETENLYQALFYFRPWGKRYDLLIGYGEGYSKPSLR